MKWMKDVKKSSWHYRLYNSLGMWQPRNLCMYCQKLFWTMAALIATIPTVLIGLVSFPTLVYLSIKNNVPVKELWAIYDIGNGLAAYLMVTVLAGVVLYGIAIIIAVGLSIEYYKDKRRQTIGAMSNDEYVTATQPGLLRSWWNAAHDKVCPILEFVDE